VTLILGRGSTSQRKGNHEVAVDFKVPPKHIDIGIFPWKGTNESFDPNIATVAKTTGISIPLKIL
jgi:hypothetical protein